MSKQPKTADDELPESVTLRITDEDTDDFTELFRRMEAAGFDKPSTYIKHLLSGLLHPDPSGEQAIRELLRELRERIDNLDSRTKSLRQTVAKSTTMLLIKTAGWPPDKAHKWVQEKLLE